MRHKPTLPKGSDTLKQMWDDRVIVLDFESIPSFDPKDYSEKGAKQAFTCLRDAIAKEVLVGADYGPYSNREMLIGLLNKDSEQKIKAYDGYGFYKTTKLINPMVVSYLDFPVLKALQIRSRTIYPWPGVKKYMNAAYWNIPLEWSVYSLDPNQLEVICYEYLREKGYINSLLLPIGRTLKDLDIIGIGAQGETVVAQVTFSKNVSAKEQALRANLSGSEKAFLFSPNNSGIYSSEINYIDIKDVFQFFGTANKMLKRMLNYQ